MRSDEHSYVVSRSGKVLDSTGRVLQEIVPGDVHDLSHAEPLASFREQSRSFYSLAAVLLTPAEDTMLPTTRKRKFDQVASRKPAENRRTLVWNHDISSSVDDIARAILKRQRKVFRRKSSRKRLTDTRGSDNCSDRHHRLVQHLRTGISQMHILQRWQSGSRELSAKWASWLLKMLRKAKPPPEALQRFLFTVLVAILPVICCGLVCQTLNILPDSEVLRAVDILCSALEKSWSCFSTLQWEILEERMYMCRQVRMKAGTWLERKRGAPASFPRRSTGVGRRNRKVDRQSLSSSSDEYGLNNDERMSNELVLSEGVKSLVRRALRERQIFTSQASCMSSVEDGGTVVSLMCSLSKMRLKVPARGICCTHMTCFDLEFYLEMNAKLVSSKREELQSSMWRCPYCGSDASWSQLIVDGFILRILESLSGDVLEVLVRPDGQWSAKGASVGPSAEDDITHSHGDDGGVRNVKPRVAVQSDESADDTREEEGSENGDLSGNEASRVRQPPVSSKSESNLCEMTETQTQRASESEQAARGSVPVLHEISLQGLIQSTLEKAKTCASSDHKGETLRAEFRKQVMTVAAGLGEI